MPRKLFPFESLEVWQEARRLMTEVYRCTRAFPGTELYGMTSQLKRSALSVANNLAEGSGRSSLKDQAHFSSQAYGSLMEVASDLIVSSDLGFVREEEVESLLDNAYNLSVRIHNLRESQLRRASSS